MDIKKRLEVITRSCVESKDGSFSQCFSSEKIAEERMTATVLGIEKEIGCWNLINSRDKNWGRNGVNHMAAGWAKGHMGERGTDNFDKQYTRFRYVIVNREHYGEPKC